MTYYIYTFILTTYKCCCMGRQWGTVADGRSPLCILRRGGKDHDFLLGYCKETKEEKDTEKECSFRSVLGRSVQSYCLPQIFVNSLGLPCLLFHNSGSIYHHLKGRSWSMLVIEVVVMWWWLMMMMYTSVILLSYSVTDTRLDCFLKWLARWSRAGCVDRILRRQVQVRRRRPRRRRGNIIIIINSNMLIKRDKRASSHQYGPTFD